MIKINLVSERKQARGKSPGGLALESGANAQSLVLASVLIAGFAGAGLWGWTTANRLADVREAHLEADAELKRLEAVRKRGDEYTARKDLLARKIGIITDLKKRQEVPVHILDQVSKNIPDFLWLDTMSAKENAINLAGKATTYNVWADVDNDDVKDAGETIQAVLGGSTKYQQVDFLGDWTP